jgi:hypothetical protein
LDTVKRIRFKYLFHGTSSTYRKSIETKGLLPVNGALHLTTHPCIALGEAVFTVRGEDLRYGYKRSVGGFPLVVKIDRSAAINLRLDRPGYYNKEAAKKHRLAAIRCAFSTDTSIRPEDISFIDTNIEAVCKELLDEIHGMTKLLPFEYQS